MTDQATEAGQEQTAEPQAEKSLDELLAEFQAEEAQGTETPSQTEQAQPKADVPPERLDRALGFVEHMMVKEEKQAQDDGISDAVGLIQKFDGLDGVPEQAVRDRLIAFAFDNPAFADAFANRHRNPQAYAAILKEAASPLNGSSRSNVDPQLTADMAAAKASVSGTSDNMPEAPQGPTLEEKAGMSRQAWEAHLKSQMKS